MLSVNQNLTRRRAPVAAVVALVGLMAVAYFANDLVEFFANAGPPQRRITTPRPSFALPDAQLRSSPSWRLGDVRGAQAFLWPAVVRPLFFFPLLRRWPEVDIVNAEGHR
jgi:hypothetical protein